MLINTGLYPSLKDNFFQTLGFSMPPCMTERGKDSFQGGFISLMCTICTHLPTSFMIEAGVTNVSMQQWAVPEASHKSGKLYARAGKREA